MIGTGTLVNAAAIAAGGAVGLLFKKGLPERFKSIIFTGSSTAVFFIAVTGVITAGVTAAENGLLTSSYMLGLLLSLVIGGVIGELLRIDKGIDALAEHLLKNAKGSSEGFVTATVVFCTGAMAIIGAINDGAQGDPSMLYTKAAIDGITALVFASVYGAGVILSAFPILLYQGTITVFAGTIGGLLSQTVINQMSLVGSAVILLIAFSLWDIKKFNVANMIPAIFMPIVLSFLPL